MNDLLRSRQVPANPGWQQGVTVRQLLGHTAGLPVHGFPGYPRGEKPPSLVGVLDGEGNTPPVREHGRPERLVLSRDAEYVQDVDARRAR